MQPNYALTVAGSFEIVASGLALYASYSGAAWAYIPFFLDKASKSLHIEGTSS